MILQHGLGVRRLFEGLAEFRFVQQLGDIGQGVEMLLELALRHQEEHDQVDRLVVQGIEVDAFLRAAQRADHFIDQIRRGVRDADAEADAGAHGGLALLDHRRDGVVMFGLDLAGRHQVVDQLIDRFPAVGRPQVSDDLLFAQNVA